MPRLSRGATTCRRLILPTFVVTLTIRFIPSWTSWDFWIHVIHNPELAGRSQPDTHRVTIRERVYPSTHRTLGWPDRCATHQRDVPGVAGIRGALPERRAPGDGAIPGAGVGAAQEAPLPPRPVLASRRHEQFPSRHGAVRLRRLGSSALLKEAGLLAPRWCVASLPWGTTRFHLQLQSSLGDRSACAGPVAMSCIPGFAACNPLTVRPGRALARSMTKPPR